MEVVVGRIAKAHGVRGELTVEVRTDSPELRFAPDSVLTARSRGGESRQLTVTAARQQTGGRLLVRFAEVPGRERADALRGLLLFADTAELPPIEDPDEFYDHQLEGLRVELTDGSTVGTVREVVHSPAGELLAVERDGKDGAVTLVPFVRAIVPEVDPVAGRVVLDPPEGLLE
ncbi:ribosome maturation factor RimM [Amycolatopsis cihanbeyliensis]|uniref:Ribosome maturation factor RimM n=1 Tax=Amycolatopsis cihanbeyliensis TaxID=1128664 RepID=A0A542DGV8_AMYCI|nr:ribosome maturation factor RimM [Amycolatopsis cihanbeyliensis]TQJ02313.1 16S rRNA processing protein RimM [Amycolatopsis cihanbeyliensis]